MFLYTVKILNSKQTYNVQSYVNDFVYVNTIRPIGILNSTAQDGINQVKCLEWKASTRQ